MADENAKSYLIWMIFGTREFLGSLITNPCSKFINSKWRPNIANQSKKNYLIGMKFGTPGFLGSLITCGNPHFSNQSKIM